MALLLCGAGAGLGPVPTAAAAPLGDPDAGVGTVVADLGPDSQHGRPGFSHDGAYYSHLVPSGDQCDLHLYDVAARRDVGLVHAHVVCDGSLVRWAAQTDTLQWQVDATADDITVYAWDAASRQVSVLARDAHVGRVTGLSADGAYLSFTGPSDLYPAPPENPGAWLYFTYDRAARTSTPLSTTGEDVRFLDWSPTGHRFVGEVYHGAPDYGQEGCFGSGTSCQVLRDADVYNLIATWSPDGLAVIVQASSDSTPVVYSFVDGSAARFPTTYGRPDFDFFVGRSPRRVVGFLVSGDAVLWDRQTGKAVKIDSPSGVFPSPDGRYLLYRGADPETYRYRDVATGADALATYRGTRYAGLIDGYWTKDGSSYVGVGPGGCSSLRQWSPETNTVSLFGPPHPQTCWATPQPFELGPWPSSVSGRFSVVYQRHPDTDTSVEYVADLRRHVLLGPVQGLGEDFAPAGSELLVVRQSTSSGVDRLLLVDPTPVPDVDDKPRWSSATPSTGTAITVDVGQQVHVVLGASDLQGTPVNPYFRWRTADGTPVKSPPRGWSCERHRLTAGATVSDCTFAPPKDYTAVRFLDLSATNYATGAQSDARSYRLEAKPTPKATGR